MVRTLIALSERDKKWLDDYSHLHHLSLAETIRLAVKLYIEQKKSNFRKEILLNTRGLWKSRKVEGLDYVHRLRKEWE